MEDRISDEALASAVLSLKLQETRPVELMATGKFKDAERLRSAADDAASHLMMAEGYLVKGEVVKAHEWLVKARYRLAEVIGR